MKRNDGGMMLKEMSSDNFKRLLGKIENYVICSTLNQVVNYIPYKMIVNEKNNENFKVLNITPSKKNESENVYFKRFDNKRWDEIIREALVGKKIINIDLEKACLKESYEFKDNSQKTGLWSDEGEPKKTLWNVTGGQRSTMLQVLKYIKTEERFDDYIIYIEGNANEIFVLKHENNDFETYRVTNEKYGLDRKDLSIKKTLNLMGFDCNEKKNYIDEEFPENIREVVEVMVKKYDNKVSNNKDFITNIRLMNKSENKKALEIVESLIKAELNDKAKDEGRYYEEVCRKNDNPFGYILEYIAVSKIKEAVKNLNCEQKYFIELQHSISVFRKGTGDTLKNRYNINKMNKLAEFDIVLLNRAGQVIVFECKSGVMTSDVSKARHYTSLAVGGVYGKPILITPFFKAELSQIHKVYFESKEKEALNEFDSAMLEAVRAASRANMDIWGIDEIEDKLKDLYKEALANE